jgi:hypothetical protein
VENPQHLVSLFQCHRWENLFKPQRAGAFDDFDQFEHFRGIGHWSYQLSVISNQFSMMRVL